MPAARYLLLFLAVSPAFSAPEPLPREKVVEHVAGGFSTLNRMYWSAGIGIWLDRPGDDLRAHFEGRRNPPWWTSANAIEDELDFMRATGRTDFDKSLGELYELHRAPGRKDARMIAELKRRGQWSAADDQTYQRRVADRAERAKKAEAEGPGGAKHYYVDFCNEYLDDSGWWGISWLKMYDRTRDPKYLATAKVIQAHIAANWLPEKGGGIMWCEDADKQRPNAITNNLFIILSARLYERTKDKQYLDWATKSLAWERDNKLYDGVGVVDAPGHHDDYWSYNQGTYVGGLTALYQATGNRGYLDEAASVADTVMTKSGMVNADGVIVEKMGTHGWDGGMFKGVLARYFGHLRDVLSATKQHLETGARIDSALRVTAASIIKNSLQPSGEFTAEWHENAQNRETTFNTQVSALAELIATLPQ